MVIAGGGISGLALAAALQAAPEASRPKVIVMERDASAEARRQGYGVTLSETNAALAGLGILEDLRASNTRSCAHWTFKDDGAVLGYFGLAFLPEERGKPTTNGVTNLRVPRNRVREILLRRLLPGTVRFGCRVIDYEEVTNDDNASSSVSVVIETRKIDDVVGGGAGRAEPAENDVDAKTETETETVRGVSLLVASDGVRSAVQRIRMPGASLNYLGVVLITGFTTLRHPLLEKQGFYTLDGARARIFTMPFRRADDDDADADADEKAPAVCTSMWQISVRVTEAEAMALAKAPRSTTADERTPVRRADSPYDDANFTQTKFPPLGSVRAFVRAVAGTWHAPVPAMFDATDWANVWAGPLYDRDEPPKPPTGANATSRVVAVGDAAHPMSPFKGMGANTALFDAWHLARWLMKAPPPRAVACFEREMVARAWVKVRASREACVAFHSAAAITGAKKSFAGVAPERAPAFLETLAARNVGAALADRLEAETKAALVEFRASSGETRGDDRRVKPYAYLKSPSEDVRKSSEVGAESAETPTPYGLTSVVDANEKRVSCSVSSKGRRVPPPALASRVEDAFHEAMRRCHLAPLTADESAVARTLVPAAASRKARPAHDWTSRAALKIAHGRAKEKRETTRFSSSLRTESGAPVGFPDFERFEGSPNAERCDGPDALAARLARVAAEVLSAETPRGEKREERTAAAVDDDANTSVASARASPEGQLFVVSAVRRAALSRSGLATCVGCGKFYAVHGGGLRQHWARGGDSKACASAAAAASNASMTDAEASAATGGLVGAAVESSAWRGAGEGRPGPWRETMRVIERDENERGETGASGASDGENGENGENDISVATISTPLGSRGSEGSRDKAPDDHSASAGEISKLRRRNAGLAAAATGDVAAMRAAFAAGAFDPADDADPHGSGALHWAAGGGHQAACEWLVDARNVLVNATRRKDGRAPLHWAARNGRLETCAWLVSRGADANAATYDGDTPFNLAVWRGHDDVARFFVSLGGVDPRRTNRWGCNALLWACIRTREDENENENDRGDGRPSETRKKGVLATVRWLVDELDVPVDVVNVNGHGAIHKCAIYGHGDVIDWLIDRDDARVAAGDPKRPALLDAAHFAPDDRNSAPSDLAATNGHVALSATLRRLEDRRSRVPAVYDGGETRAR